MQNQIHITEREALKIFETIAPIYCASLPPVLNIADISRLFKKSRETVTKWIKSGKFIPEIEPGHYSTPQLIYWLITNEFLEKRSLEDQIADRIAGEAVLSISKNLMTEGG